MTISKQIDDTCGIEATTLPVLSVVVIGRNEGARLTRCLESIGLMRLPAGPMELIYVDSKSSDDSVETARKFNARTLSLESEYPCAAAARNLGWRAARAPIVLFLDGDTVLNRDFVADSIDELADPRTAVVFGHRREISPKASIYNRIIDLDWISAAGPADFCGGDALIRRDVLELVGGYDEGLIAGEEPEMCRRIRAAGYSVLQVDQPMTLHDIAMTRVSQYWRRGVRSGYAYAEISARYGDTDRPLWSSEARHNRIHGGAILALFTGAIILSIATRSLIPIVAAIVVLSSLALRTAYRYRWKTSNLYTLLLFGLHSHLGQIPILFGQLKYRLDRYRGKRTALIEYQTIGLKSGRVSE